MSWLPHRFEHPSRKMRRFKRSALLVLLPAISLFSSACSSDRAPASATPQVEAGVELLGGDTTIFDDTHDAFTFAARNLSSDHRDSFSLGDHFFNRNWVTAPASISGNDGLGPTFNATSCSACHFKDGRGGPPEKPGDPFLGILLRLSVPGQDAHGGPLAEPSYGGQLNPYGILTVPGEGTPSITYEEVPGTYTDGTAYSLRKPTYHIDDLAYGPMAADVMISPRVAPPMIGLGLLQAISEDTLTALADENDDDHDGISGRINRVWDQRLQTLSVGRFGWKANQPTIEQQTAGAFLGDIGITSSMNPTDSCTEAQTQCLAAPSGGSPGAPELTDEKLDSITSYGMTVAVPARRNWTDTTVQKGEKLFVDIGCSGCHVSKIETGELKDYPELSGQTIRPFTDLLLHDMGDDLADGRPDFMATGNEWRTTPLWGLGLHLDVSPGTFLLHDGRARDLPEAILWHGGEAKDSREMFRSLPSADRDALLAFLGSL